MAERYLVLYSLCIVIQYNDRSWNILTIFFGRSFMSQKKSTSTVSSTSRGIVSSSSKATKMVKGFISWKLKGVFYEL